jgi:hypothetical protein
LVDSEEEFSTKRSDTKTEFFITDLFIASENLGLPEIVHSADYQWVKGASISRAKLLLRSPTSTPSILMVVHIYLPWTVHTLIDQ